MEMKTKNCTWYSSLLVYLSVVVFYLLRLVIYSLLQFVITGIYPTGSWYLLKKELFMIFWFHVNAILFDCHEGHTLHDDPLLI